MPKSQTSHTVTVNVPVRTAYNQWTQFEEFPKFMSGVEQVVQRDDDTVYFRVNVGGKKVEYEADIVEQHPDDRIVWKSRAGKKTGGMVQFEPVGEGQTRITLDMMYEPEGALENVGDLLGMVSRQTRSDLENFKKYIEERGQETGAWRGEI
jgi:uncharacterized membrane protein